MNNQKTDRERSIERVVRSVIRHRHAGTEAARMILSIASQESARRDRPQRELIKAVTQRICSMVRSSASTEFAGGGLPQSSFCVATETLAMN